jgi:hypothetical protein
MQRNREQGKKMKMQKEIWTILKKGARKMIEYVKKFYFNKVSKDNQQLDTRKNQEKTLLNKQI